MKILFALVLIFYPGLVLARTDNPGLVLIDWLENVGAELISDPPVEIAEITVFRNVRIHRYDRILVIDELRTDGIAVGFDNLKVTRINGGDGIITAKKVVMSDMRAFMNIFEHVKAIPFADENFENINEEDIDYDDVFIETPEIPDHHFGEICAGLQQDGLVEYKWKADDVRITEDIDGLPLDLLAAEIHFETVGENHRIIRNNNNCVSDDIMPFFNMTIRAVDGAMGRVLSGTVGIISNHDMVLDIYEDREIFQINKASIENSKGVVSASLGNLSYSSVRDDNIDILLCTFFLMHDRFNLHDSFFDELDEIEEMSSTEMLEKALKTRSGIAIAVTDMNISVADFFPVEMIQAMGLRNTENITGEFMVNGTLVDGLAALRSTIELPGFLEGELTADLSLPNTLDVTLPGFIANRLPIPGELLDMKIHGMSFRIDDQGAGGILRSLTGLTPSEYISTRLELIQARLTGRLPDYITTKLTDAREVLADIIKHGGRIDIAPETPRTILALAVQGMMQPGGLSETMGISVNIR